MHGGMHMGMQLSRADARQFSGKATDDTRVQVASLPLPTRFFPKVRLSATMVREYEHTARLLLADALEQLRRERIIGGVDDSWRDIGAASGFKRFTKVDGGVQHHRVQGVVRASLPGLMQVLYAENATRLAARRRAFYSDHVDAQTLAVLMDRSAENRNEHMALRWLATELSNSSAANQRDMCVLEFTGTTVDRDGQPIGFSISHSVELAECPSLAQSHGLLRRVGTDVILVRPASDHGHSEVILSGSSAAASDIAPGLLTTYLSTIAAGLGKLPVAVQARCLANVPMLDRKHWVAAADRKTCNVCVSKFGYLSKKHHCRSCGEVTCKACIVTRTVGEETKFCKKCVIVATSHEERQFYADRSDVSSSMASRNSITSLSSVSSSGSSSYSATSYVHKPSTSSAPKPKFHVDMKLLDDLRGGSNSLTASEDGSYGSASYLDQGGEYPSVSSLDEDTVMFVDTRDMRRGQPQQFASSVRSTKSTTNYTQQYGNMSQVGSTSRAPSPVLPKSSRGGAPVSGTSLQHVEDSIAHQRHLLEKMMTQARYTQQTQAAAYS